MEELIDALKFIGEQLEGINEKLDIIAYPSKLKIRFGERLNEEKQSAISDRVVEAGLSLHGEKHNRFKPTVFDLE